MHGRYDTYGGHEWKNCGPYKPDTLTMTVITLPGRSFDRGKYRKNVALVFLSLLLF